MSNAVIGAIVFLVMLIMIFVGIPVWLSMFSCSIVGLFLVSGESMMLNQMTSGPYVTSASYSYAVLPLFMLVGTLAGSTGIAEGAYSSMKKWLGGIRGGLLYATIAANAIFGACAGIGTAGTAVFGKIALPELERAGYEKKLSMGTITASSALSGLIPPSITIIMFCIIISDLSIGTALMCGLGAGLVTTLAMFITVKVITIVSPAKVPVVKEEDKHIPIKEKLSTLKLLVPIVLLFGLIIGGSFYGWFSPTVGGAVASMVIVIYALAKRIKVKDILNSFWEGAVMNGGIFLIIIGGTLFSRFISLSGLASAFSDLITSLNINRYLFFMIVFLFYIICGCIMDIISCVIITVPILFPPLEAMGFDPYMLCITLVFVAAIASITPPIGMTVFVAANVMDAPAMDIFQGVVPYFFCECAVVILMMFFPGICTYMPTLMTMLGGG